MPQFVNAAPFAIIMEAKPVPPPGPRQPRPPAASRSVALGGSSDDLLLPTSNRALATDAAAAAAAASTPSRGWAAPGCGEDDEMAAALAASMAVAHVQEIGIERSPLAPSERHVEPASAPEPALIPSHRTPAAAEAETASARDTRLGQVIAQRCVALREELAALGMGKLKERAAAEGLPAAEVERTLAAINGFSQAGGGKGGSESTAAAAQQALRERIVMHVAYKPANKRGKLGAHAMAVASDCARL